MTNDDLHRRMDAARIRAELTVQELWMRYLGLGGTNDAFDLDAYLQGLVSWDAFQLNVLAQSANEALSDSYDTYRVLLASAPASDGSAERVRTLIQQLLYEHPADSHTDEP